MRRRVRKALNISAEEARRALAVLVSEGRIAARDVVSAIARRQKLVAEIRERLAALGDEGSKLASSFAKETPRLVKRSRKAAKEGARRGRRVLSAAARTAYQAQGRYMAAVRPLSKALRRKIKAIRQKSGVKTAIETAQAWAKKKPIMRHTREG